MASGERPFKGDTSLSVLSAILKDSPKPLGEINPATPSDLTRIVRRCLSKDPDDRYQSAVDLRSDLDDLRQSPPGAGRHTGGPGHEEKLGRGGHGWPALLVVAPRLPQPLSR